MSHEVEHHNSGHRPTPAPIHHELRRTDTDPRIAKRAERQVAVMFTLSALSAIGFVVAFWFIDPKLLIGVPVIGTIPALNLAMGLTLGLAILMIGTGAIHWARKLMPDTEVVEERQTFAAGVEESGFVKRPIVRRTLLGAMALLPIPLVVMLRDLGPDPQDKKFHTVWRKGTRLLSDVSGQPLLASDIPVGNLVNAIPEGLHELEEETKNLNDRAKAVIIVVRIDPNDIRSQQGGTEEQPWDYNGVLAFSKVCTHVGCPISLYEQRTHHLLCPCHQSTYDLADSGRVIFGPASRRIPQLAITVDNEGYLVAQGDFAEPVGPSFWEIG
jgi:ubiquinol-cytochrome c reductase iron-sulfur subunit